MKTKQCSGQFISPKPRLSMLTRNGKPFHFTFLMAVLLALSCLMNACEKSGYKPAVPNTANKAVNTTNIAASAAVVTDTTYTYNDVLYFASPCNGENVTLNYSVSFSVHSVINNNRNNLTGHTLITYEGSGDKGSTYKGTGTETYIENAPLKNGAYTFNYVSHASIVGKAGEPDFVIRTTFKLTFTPSGQLSVYKGTDSFECKG